MNPRPIGQGTRATGPSGLTVALLGSVAGNGGFLSVVTSIRFLPVVAGGGAILNGSAARGRLGIRTIAIIIGGNHLRSAGSGAGFVIIAGATTGQGVGQAKEKNGCEKREDFG